MPAINSCVNKSMKSVVALGAVALISNAASADINAPIVNMLWDASSDSVGEQVYHMNGGPTGGGEGQWFDMGNGLITNSGGTQGGFNPNPPGHPSLPGNAAWSMDWDITVRNQPGGPAANDGSINESVSAQLAITNNTGAFQVFWALVTVNIAGYNNEQVNISGNVSATVTDLLGDNATLQNPSAGPHTGAPMYQAQIGGTGVRDLWSNPHAVNAGAFNSNSDQALYGTVHSQPLESYNVVGRQGTIGVWLRVELSPFDIATVIGDFYVEAVPGPAGLPLLAMGLMGIGRRRRA